MKILSLSGPKTRGAYTYDYHYYTFYGLFDQFKKNNHEVVMVRTFWPTFYRYAKTIMADSDYNYFINSTQIIISGYESSIPYAFYYYKNKADSIVRKGFMSNYPSDNQKISVIKALENNPTINTMVQLARTTIANKAKSYKGMAPIGGPSSTGYIKRDGSHHEDFQKKYFYKTVIEEMTAAYNDKILRHYRSPDDSVKFKASIEHFYNIHK